MLLTKLFAVTFLVAYSTDAGSISVARKLQPFNRVPSRGYMQEAPVPTEIRLTIVSTCTLIQTPHTQYKNAPPS